MNYYIVVEGKAETLVYRHWIPLVNPQLTHVDHISKINRNNFLIVSGEGYPYYFDILDAAIGDVEQNQNIDQLIVAIDSEEMTWKEKYSEIEQFITARGFNKNYHIIVQHFCLETWALGNQRVGPRQPKSQKMREYKDFFDVLVQDPELMPAYTPEPLNRAQFAYKYLKLMLNEKNMLYSKRNPKALLHDKYFLRVKSRFETTGHIQSCSKFLTAFIE